MREAPTKRGLRAKWQLSLSAGDRTLELDFEVASMSEMCVEGGISCTLAVVVLSTPYLVLCATTPSRLKVYAKYLAFTHLDRKTELLSMFTFGVCVANAACSFAFMAVGGFTDVLLTLYALSMTSAWLCAIVQMNQQLCSSNPLGIRRLSLGYSV